MNTESLPPSADEHQAGTELHAKGVVPVPERLDSAQLFSPAKLARINFESFRFSQGSPELHPLIMQYLRGKYGDRMSDDAIAESLLLTAPSVEKFVNNDKVHAPTDATVADQMQKISSYWKDARNIGPEAVPQIVTRILRKSLERDYLKLAVGGERHRGEGMEDGRARPSSKFLSQVVYYGLNAHTTGVNEFDDMFRDVTSALHDHTQDVIVVTRFGDGGPGDWDLDFTTLGSLTRELVDIHTSHYPDELSRLPVEWRPEPSR